MPISGSVGRRGVNRKQDVALVQSLLNIVRLREGRGQIAIDGLVGPETIGAILGFQEQHTQYRDARLDPGGPTLELLEEMASDAIVTAMLHVITELEDELSRRNLRLPWEIDAQLAQVRAILLALGTEVAGPGSASPPPLRTALYVQSAGRPPFVLAAGPVAGAAAIGAAAVAEAMMYAILATIALLILIQSLPAMSEAVERLLREIQLLMARLLDQVQEAIEGVEDLIRRNARAGMLCSELLILFRQLCRGLIDILTGPRPTDELGRVRWRRDLERAFTEWQRVLGELLACLMANGAV